MLTDSNDKEHLTWGTLVDNYGYVESPNETPSSPTRPRWPCRCSPVGATTQTVAEMSQVASVRATAYGDPITNTPENRPFYAIDGNDATAWTEGAFGPGTDESLQIQLTHPVTTNHITLIQPQPERSVNRHVTQATLTFDGNRHET